MMKKILITGMNSYIGDSVKDYLMEYPDKYSVSLKDTLGWTPESEDFKGYDVVFNVAGIAHIRETDENRHLYYEVNRDLAIRIAKSAKEAGVKQFVLLSTMSVYGLTVGIIGKETLPKPVNAYGKSKLDADKTIREFSNDDFKFVCLRPPMVYGKGCKGNYQSLKKFAVLSPIFPNYDNERSMIYIGNLCEFIKNCIDMELDGLFFPQNAQYVNTSEMVRLIAEENNKHIKLTKMFNIGIKLFQVNVIKKVFGNLVYEGVDLVDKYGFEESIRLTER